MGDRSKAIARLARVRELLASPAAMRPHDWRDVARCSFCGANGHEVERLIAGSGKVASGHAVMICENCIDVCAQIVADHRARR